jgi:hypothetical protein
MPIALALPFAEAAGIAVAGLSAAAIANKVSEYIKLNPEDSMMILKMINPASGGAFAGEGISTLFKKKAKTEKEPSIEDLEEIGEDLSQSDKAKVMKAYGKSKGADKRQRMIDIAKKLGLAGEEKERQKSFDEVEGRYEDSDFEEERTKPKFDYTKFFKADGGRIGYVGGGLATTQDFANALKSVSAGTTYQQQIQAKEYARNEASNLLSQAMRSADPNKGPGLQGIYDTFFRTTLSPGIRPKTFTPDSSGRMIMYSARDRDAILDSMANQMLNTTPYADPKASASEAYGKMMQQKTEEAYGTPDKYRAEAMTLGMPVEAYYDYLTTRDDKNIMQQYRKQDPYFDASTYVPFTEADRTSDGGRIGFANGGIENIIGKNLDNITNVAKGLDKEMLDMTYSDKYYKDVIQPAKLGQAPIPGRMEMMLKSKPFTAVGIGMRPGTFGERAQPTKAASQFLNTLGKGAKFVGTVDANDGFRTSPATYYNSAPNFNADVLREEEDAQYNLPQKNIFQRAGNFIGKLNLEDYLPFIGQKSLTGTMGRGIGNLFQNIAPARYGTSQRAYNALTPQGRSTVGSIYGPGGIMSGYNAVSAFGRGPIGAIDNRIGNIYNRRAPQTDASKKTIQDLYKAREKIMQTTLDSDNQYTGKTAPRGQRKQE